MEKIISQHRGGNGRSSEMTLYPLRASYRHWCVAGLEQRIHSLPARRLPDVRLRHFHADSRLFSGRFKLSEWTTLLGAYLCAASGASAARHSTQCSILEFFNRGAATIATVGLSPKLLSAHQNNPRVNAHPSLPPALIPDHAALQSELEPNAWSILIVEDEPGDHALVVNYLRHKSVKLSVDGLKLVWAKTLSEALAAAQDLRFDMVLLDLSLPDSVGVKTVSAMTAALPGTPVVVLTSSDDEELALEALGAGAQDFLVKGESIIGY